mgnify:CR=1 FL=1
MLQNGCATYILKEEEKRTKTLWNLIVYKTITNDSCEMSQVMTHKLPLG